MNRTNLWSKRGLRWLVACAAMVGPACGNAPSELANDPGNLPEQVSSALTTGEPESPDVTRRELAPSCLNVRNEITLAKRPVDIVFVIDNSASMIEEIVAIQDNINGSFADVISKSGIDYRVIMVTDHGDAVARQSVCISAPLSSLPTCRPAPLVPGLNPPRFYHYALRIGSLDSLQRLLGSYNGVEKDRFGLAPAGWSQWLRSDAFKVIVVISDDNSSITETAFDTQLLAKTPQHFGDSAHRNYAFYTIGGLKGNVPATKAWAPADPLQTGICGSGAYSNALIYQRLSVLTGGLRFPICEYANFNTLFTNVASGVVQSAKASCDFPLPTLPAGQTLDPGSVRVEYTPMGTGAVTPFTQVASAAACAPNSFYLTADKVFICPDACGVVQKDSAAKLEVIYSCLAQPNGSACSTGTQCSSTFCADGVCCDTACGGGSDNDCQVCSVAKGAAADGTCGKAAAGTTCRAASGPCDNTEVCSGASTTCPVDKFRTSSTVCRAAVGPCDAAEKCSGSSAFCPADVLKSNTTVCRSASGACDQTEFCSGTSTDCPADQFKPVIAICRPAAGDCDLADFCTGASPACPPNDYLPAGTVCREAVGECDVDEVCSGSRASCPANRVSPDGTACTGGMCKAGMCI